MPCLKRKWVFMDETGLLVNDPSQPFFALGALKLEQTATLYGELNRLNQRARSKVNPRFEFKFNRINSNNRRLYMDLVDLFFQFPGLYFKAFVVDTQHPGFDLEGYFRGSWEAQISYASLLLENIIGPDEQIAVLADYLDKPKAATTFFEDAVSQVGRSYKGGASVPPVFNVCMLESDASLFIQMVDVLLGLVVYDCKARRGVHGANLAKTSVLKVLKGHLKKQDFSRTQHVNGPPYFGIWHFAPYGAPRGIGGKQ